MTEEEFRAKLGELYDGSHKDDWGVPVAYWSAICRHFGWPLESDPGVPWKDPIVRDPS